jgi:very-short-patch-repair endonuclease
MRTKNNRNLLTLRRELGRSSTEAERALWSILKSKKMKGLKFFRQYSIGNYILDFYSPRLKLAIEADGGQHNIKKNKIHDQQRDAFLKKHGIKVMRFWNDDILANLDGVYLNIESETNKRS